MKKVLVIGASGMVGMNVLKYLLSEGKYEITALDLKNKKVLKSFHRYRKRINIIYGDLLDRNLVDNLVKENDYVINLASCLPPLVEYKKDLANIIEYNGTENIIRAINYYNKACHLIYVSSTSVYGNEKGNVKNKIKIEDYNYFNEAKYQTEKLIEKKLKKYTILRMPLVLGDLRKDPFIYNISLNDQVEIITKEDAAYAVAKTVDSSDMLNKKVLNLGGGNNCQCSFRELLLNILKYHGLSFNFVATSIFVAKNFTSPILEDSSKSNALLNYQNDSIQSYFMRQKRRSKNRKIAILLARPISYFINRKR